MDELLTIPLDHSIDQRLLNVEDKTRANLFPWNGQFSPQLIETLLSEYGNTSEKLLDPFVGSGTVLIEAARKGLAAVGSDINPAPFKMASLYRLCNTRENIRSTILRDFEIALTEAIDTDFALQSSGLPKQDVRQKLLDFARNLPSLDASIVADALVVLVDFHRPLIDVDRVFSVWKQLKKKVAEFPYSSSSIEVLNKDARDLDCPASSCSMMITSPPYINVFNYHQKYRRSAEALGWDLLHVAQSEIGSNRKHRGNRFLTVTQYCLDLSMALVEARRICRVGSRLIIVLGRESQVRKTAFFNGSIVASLASKCAGLKTLFRQERVFMNRFGNRITEDILHFENTPQNPDICPTEIARHALVAAREYAPSESMRDLEEAIARIDETKPSAIYKSIAQETNVRTLCATNSAS